MKKIPQTDLYSKRQLYTDMMLASELGFVLAVPVAAGTIIGWLLDGGLGTKPFWTLTLLVFGLVITIYNIVRIIKKFTRV